MLKSNLVSMEQITYDKIRGSFNEHQQFVMDTLEKVKGNKEMEAKWKQIQEIIRSKER